MNPPKYELAKYLKDIGIGFTTSFQQHASTLDLKFVLLVTGRMLI